MKCILLVAGYATRLYPLTENMPKSLLEVAGKTILEHILDKVKGIESINEVILVSNDRFYIQFKEWTQQYSFNKKLTVLNDQTTSNENRLGAIADLKFAIDDLKIEDNLLVLAGDNLFDFSLEEFVGYFHKVQGDCITVNEIKDIEALKRTGVVEIDEDGIVTGFEEKPKVPKSNLAVPPFYIYQKATLPLIERYLNEGNNPDAPGNFVPWLMKKNKVYTYRFQGRRYDIGTHESYKIVNELFTSKEDRI
jgi:glucose-1-phosphate thymidylyltransferase